MVKRAAAMVSILALSFLIVGCGGLSSHSSMQIKPAELTEKESRIMQLVKPSTGSSAVYDYTVNHEAKSVSVTCYKLDENGKWIVNSGAGSFPISGATGRIAISFDRLGDGMRVGVQDGDAISISENDSVENEAAEGISSVTSYSSDTERIEYEKEIPLAMQVFTSKNEIRSCGVEFFSKPEEILENGYEEAYAVAIKFSNQGML